MIYIVLILIVTLLVSQKYKENSSCKSTDEFLFLFFFRQKLLIPNGSCSIILNTYFCQKAVAKEIVHEEYCQDTPLPRRNISLAQMFRIEDITSSSSRSQVNSHWHMVFILVVILISGFESEDINLLSQTTYTKMCYHYYAKRYESSRNI